MTQDSKTLADGYTQKLLKKALDSTDDSLNKSDNE